MNTSASGLDSQRFRVKSDRWAPILLIIAAIKEKDIQRKGLSTPTLEGKFIPSNVQFARAYLSWTPKFRPVVKMDFYRSAVRERKQMYESETQTAQCGL